MILVGICDDTKYHRDCLVELCEQYFQECPMEHEILEDCIYDLSRELAHEYH